MGANKNEDKKRFLKGKKMKVKKHIWANMGEPHKRPVLAFLFPTPTSMMVLT